MFLGHTRLTYGWFSGALHSATLFCTSERRTLFPGPQGPFCRQVFYGRGWCGGIRSDWTGADIARARQVKWSGREPLRRRPPWVG